MQYEDPCLTCPKHDDANTNDCVCKKWEEYEQTRIEEVAKADLTIIMRCNMTVKELKEKLDKLPEEAGLFIKDGEALVPIHKIVKNSVTETDYETSYILT